jgi:hypothetical protein
LLKGRGYSIYLSRKEIGHGKIAGSDENGFGVEESQSSNPVMLFNLGEELCPSLSSIPRGAGGSGNRDQNRIKFLTLEVLEFIRRFLLHLLPDRFVKIRHYGLLSNCSRKIKLQRCQKLLGVSIKEETEESPKETWQDPLTRITGIDPRVCPFCGQGKMIQREILPACAIRTADRVPQYAGRPP